MPFAIIPRQCEKYGLNFTARGAKVPVCRAAAFA
jgi:hypothetical protein